MRNNFVEKKETFFGIKTKMFSTSKNGIFPKGSKNLFFLLYLVLVKIRLETRFNSILDRKETFFDDKKKMN